MFVVGPVALLRGSGPGVTTVPDLNVTGYQRCIKFQPLAIAAWVCAGGKAGWIRLA